MTLLNLSWGLIQLPATGSLLLVGGKTVSSAEEDMGWQILAWLVPITGFLLAFSLNPASFCPLQGSWLTPRRWLNLQEYQSKKLMQDSGVAVQRFYVANTASDALEAAKRLSESSETHARSSEPWSLAIFTAGFLYTGWTRKDKSFSG